MRGFEIAHGYETYSVNLPKRQTMHSAGYDIESIETIEIGPNEIKLVTTGLKAFMQEDEVLKIYIRSSIAVKKKLMMANGVGIIDADYYGNPKNDGHIMIPLYNFSSNVTIINKGEKIAQGVFEKFLTVNDEEAIILKRSGGFGSSSEQ